VSVRAIVSVIAFAFTAYLAARGLLWTGPVDHPWIIYLALPFYLVVTWLWIVWDRGRWRSWMRRLRASGEGGDPATSAPRPRPAGATPGARSRLPLWGSALAIAVALLVPNAVMFAVAPDARTQPYATWVIGGIGALMTIVMVRRRPWVAWSGMVLTGVSVSVWIGPVAALSLGMVGSIVWVAAAQLLMIALDRAARDTRQLAGLQQAASAWQAAQAGRQRERRLQVQRALQIAGPVLGRTIETGGNLRGEEKLEARLAEGRLRDELRGARLLDDVVRAQLEAVRRRGVNVTMFDEGGLEDLDEAALAVIRAELADTLRSAESARIIIRTSPHDRVAVTVVGRSGDGDELSDEDSVDLWREIPRLR
jgi:hypothetical protein